MVRITLKIDQRSPFLRVLSGVLHVEEVDIQRISLAPVELFRCKFRKEEHTLGYSSFEGEAGIPTSLFNCIKPLLDEKIRSYWKGMVLDKDDYAWIPMEGDGSWACLNRLEKEVGGYIQSLTRDGDEMEEVVQLEDSLYPVKPKLPSRKSKKS